MKKIYMINIYVFCCLIIAGVASASSPRLVLVEECTSSYSKTSGEKNPKLVTDLQALGNLVIPTMIHTNIKDAPGKDPFAEHNPGLFQRIGLYTLNVTIPSLYVNGKNEELENVTTAANSYKDKLSPYSIIIIEKRETDTIIATVIIHSDLDMNANQVFFIAVNEKHIVDSAAGDNGEVDFYWVTRMMFPPDNYYRAGLAVGLKAGQSVTVEFKIPISPAWNKDNIEVIGFIQDISSKEVLQAARTTTEQDVDPAIDFPLTKLDFEKVPVSRTLKLKVKNSGILPLKIENLTIENDPDAAFKILTKFPFIIGYKMESEVEVEFTPKQNKPYNSTLKITSNAGNGKTKSIGLTGTGSGVETKPDITFNVQVLEFGKVSKETIKSVTVTNSGYANLLIGDITIENDPKDVFDVVPKNYEPIPRGGTANIDIKFKPRKSINYSATLKVSSNAPNSKMLDITGTGQNVVPENPEITVNETTIDFGNVSTNKTIPLTITNSGKGELVIESFDIQSDGSDVFTITSPKPAPIPEGESVNIDLNFRPFGNEEYSAFLTITSNATESPTKIITLMGVGKDLEDSPNITILDKEINFNETYKGEKFVTFLNSGTGTLQISNVSILNNPDLVFELVESKIPDVEPGKNGKIAVRFTAKDYKLYNSDLYFKSNTGPGGSSVDHTVPLKAFGILSVEDYKIDENILRLEVNPNPAGSNSVIGCFYGTDMPGELSIQLFDNTGNFVKSVFKGSAGQGMSYFNLPVQGISDGMYYICAAVAGYKYILPVVVVK